MDIKKIKVLREKLRVLERETQNLADPQSDCCGLTLAQCHTLLEIGERGEISLVNLAAAMKLDTSTLSRTIQGLVTIGLVNRTASAKDRRCVEISLTEQGGKVYDQIERTFNAYFARVLEFVPADKQDDILNGFMIFAEALERASEQARCCREGVLP
jgi:DNA-binding MarR family transcriptional regulator